MRRFIVALFTLLLLILTGCGMTQNADRESNVLSRKTVYYSKISAKDCYLCGGGIENRIPSYWGQNNVALISLNTFEIKPLEINRYDINGKLVEEYAGYVSFGGNDSIDGGFSACLMIEHDRGFATGSVDFFNDKTLNVDKAASFLCTDCLNKILPQDVGPCFGVGVIHLDTKEIRLFEEDFYGFELGDFYINCNLKEGQNDASQKMNLLIFYCPIRYEETP